jgi:hypothetical protein
LIRCRGLGELTGPKVTSIASVLAMVALIVDRRTECGRRPPATASEIASTTRAVPA